MGEPLLRAPWFFGDEELVAVTDSLIGTDLSGLPLAQVEVLITITQHATDRLLNELERRGAINIQDGVPVIPYVADHVVETILTRQDA